MQSKSRPILPAIGGLAAFLTFAIVAADAATPPAQPTSGPGGGGDKAATIAKRAVGRADAATYAYHAAGTAPTEGRPVAVFLHAWGAPNPQAYGAWIDHLTRNGWLVLFPRFQEVNRTRPADATARALKALKVAFEDLAADAEARPDTKRLAFLGHLAGVPLSANLAAQAAAEGLPAPKLLYAAMPGGIARDAKSRGIPLGDLSTIAPGTLMVTVIGDRDARAADAAAKRILREASAVPPARKLFVRALSDDHGFPALTVPLAAPAGLDAAYDSGPIKLPAAAPDQKPAPFKWTPDMALSGEQTTLVAQINNARADTVDHLAFWRTFDLAAAVAFAGGDANVLKDDNRFSDMQRWSDGWPVKRLSVEVARPTAPGATEAAAAARGGRR